MKKNLKIVIMILLSLIIVSCDLLFPVEEEVKPKDDGLETPAEIPEVNTVAEDFIDSFDTALGVSSALNDTQRTSLKTNVTTNSNSFIESRDLTQIIPLIVGFYIEGLGDLTLSEPDRLDAIQAISETSVVILNGNEELINSSTSRAITVNTDTLLYILENISKAIVKNVPKCGFSEDTYAAATERTVKSLVGSLDEGGLAEDTMSAAAQFITLSAITQLSESAEFDNITGEIVQSITKGATEGVADISLATFTQEDMAPMVESVTKGAVEGLGEISDNQAMFELILPQLTQGSTQALNVIKDDLGDTLDEAVQSIAQGSTEALKEVSILSDTSAVLTLISESVSENALSDIIGITTEEVTASVVSGVAEGAQQISNEFDAEALDAIIVINDADGTAQVTDLTTIIDEGVTTGQEEVPADVKEIWAALDLVASSGWDNNQHELIPAQLVILRQVVSDYPQSDLASIYDTIGWLLSNQMWDLMDLEDHEAAKVKANEAIEVLLKAAYEYDLYSWSAFWALEKLGSAYGKVLGNYDVGFSMYNEILDRFPEDSTKRLIGDWGIISIHFHYLWNELDGDEFEDERRTLAEDTLIPLLIPFTADKYPNYAFTDWLGGNLIEAQFRLADQYRTIQDFDSAITILEAASDLETDDNKKVRIDFDIMETYQDQFWTEHDGDENSGQRTAFINEKLLPAINALVRENYPDFTDEADEGWRFTNALERKAEAYKNLAMWDDALSIYNELLSIEGINTFYIKRDIMWVYWEQADNYEDDGNYDSAIESFKEIKTIWEDYDLDLAKIEFDLSTSEVAEIYFSIPNSIREIANRYNHDKDDKESSIPYYEEALSLFLEVTLENFPDIDEGDDWAIRESFEKALEILVNLDRSSEAIILANNRLAEDISDFETGYLYMVLGEIYKEMYYNENDNATRLTLIGNALENLILSENILYDLGNFLDEGWLYVNTALTLSNVIIESMHASNDGNNTISELLTNKVLLTTISSRIRTIQDHPNDLLETYRYESLFPQVVAQIIGSDNPEYLNYLNEAIELQESLQAIVLNYNIDSWLATEILNNLFNSYIMNKDITNAETLMYQIIGDPNNDEWLTADVTQSMCYLVLETMKEAYESNNDDRDPIDGYATQVMTFAELLHANYIDIDNGEYTLRGAEILADLYFNYYYYQVYWNPDPDTATAVDIEDTKASAIIYINEVHLSNPGDMQWMLDELNL